MKLNVLGDKLVLNDSATAGRVMGLWLLLVGTFVSACFLVSGSGVAGLIGGVLLLVSLVAAVVLLVQPDTSAEFDLRKREIVIWRRFLSGRVHAATLPFREVAHIGLVKWENDTGYSYGMELVTLDRSSHSLSAVSSWQHQLVSDFLSIIVDATGISRRDRDGTSTGINLFWHRKPR